MFNIYDMSGPVETSAVRYVRRGPIGQRQTSSYPPVRRAALALFATCGTTGTSVRKVARLADVSPSVVQHHYRTKEYMRDDVDHYVRRLAVGTFGHLRTDVDRVTLRRVLRNFVEDFPFPLRYLARGVVDRELGTLAVLDTYLELATRWLPVPTARGLILQTLSDAQFGPALADRHAWSSSPRRCTRIRLVDPTVPGGEPATTTTRSPVW